MSDMNQTASGQAKKKIGRPKKSEPPRADYHAIDTLLVMGELRPDDGTGRGPTTVYPSYRDLAKRFGISHSLIATYSSRHDCLRRRESAALRIRKLTDEKVIARRGTTLAESKERMLAIIDRYIEEFGKALEEGRVRVDSVSDLNVMVRLREFLQGGPDSRQEVRGLPTLEELNRRYAEAHRREREEGDAAAGVVDRDRPSARRGRLVPDEPPAASSASTSQEVRGHVADELGLDDDDLVDDDDDADAEMAASD